MSSKDERIRTADVSVDGNVTFESLFLPEAVKKGLEEMGIAKPSPIQIQAIPVAMTGKSTPLLLRFTMHFPQRESTLKRCVDGEANANRN